MKEISATELQAGLGESLLAAALQLLDTEGEIPSLRAVARHAGVSAMAPYRHFPDKSGLMAAVASRGFRMLHDVLAAADDHPDSREALIAQGMAFLHFARTHPALFRLMYSDQYGSADTDAVKASYDILANRVARIVPRHATAATLACRSLVQGLATIELNKRLTAAETGEMEVAVRLLVAGLASPMD